MHNLEIAAVGIDLKYDAKAEPVGPSVLRHTIQSRIEESEIADGSPGIRYSKTVQDLKTAAAGIHAKYASNVVRPTRAGHAVKSGVGDYQGAIRRCSIGGDTGKGMHQAKTTAVRVHGEYRAGTERSAHLRHAIKHAAGEDQGTLRTVAVAGLNSKVVQGPVIATIRVHAEDGAEIIPGACAAQRHSEYVRAVRDEGALRP